MIRYVLSCKQCAFSADANDLRGLGSHLNRHGSGCGRDPVLALHGQLVDGAVSAVRSSREGADEAQQQVSRCA